MAPLLEDVAWVFSLQKHELLSTLILVAILAIGVSTVLYYIIAIIIPVAMVTLYTIGFILCATCIFLIESTVIFFNELVCPFFNLPPLFAHVPSS